MPSSPNYVRDYKQEVKTSKARGERGGHDSPNSIRMRARRKFMKKGLVKPFDGKDIDHKKPLSKGGSAADSNLRVVSAHANRSYARTPSGAVKGK